MSSDLKRKVRARWESLTPNHKRMAWLAVMAVPVMAMLVWLASKDVVLAPTKRSDVQNMLTRADARDMGLSGLARDVDSLQRQVYTLEQSLEAARKREAAAATSAGVRRSSQAGAKPSSALEGVLPGFGPGDPGTNPSPAEDGALGDSLLDEAASDDLDERTDQGDPEGPSPRSNAGDYLGGGESDGSAPHPGVSRPAVPGGVTSQGGTPGRPTDALPAAQTQAPPLPPPPPPRIRRLGYEAPPKAEKVASTKSRKDDRGSFIPAGSMLTGVLIAGMDAPTGIRNQGDPIPVLVRLKSEAILPNRFRADLRECFIVGSAYGDLSSERAYLRGEALSCVRSDGGVIETRLAMYGVGEDGKAGMRGRLVSKQGQIIARAMLAGFAQGASQAFQPMRVPTISTTGDGSAQFQRAFGSDYAAQAGVMGGASNAMNSLAQYFLQMAQQLFPVIEIDGGREITFVVTRGSHLQLMGHGDTAPMGEPEP